MSWIQLRVGRLWLASPLSTALRTGPFVDVWSPVCPDDCSPRHLSKSSLCSDGGGFVMSYLPDTWELLAVMS